MYVEKAAKTTLVRKICAHKIDEIDTRDLHQSKSMYRVLAYFHLLKHLLSFPLFELNLNELVWTRLNRNKHIW